MPKITITAPKITVTVRPPINSAFRVETLHDDWFVGDQIIFTFDGGKPDAPGVPSVVARGVSVAYGNVPWPKLQPGSICVATKVGSELTGLPGIDWAVIIN
jgi:hypothetical protein